jgi:hypothetical protein
MKSALIACAVSFVAVRIETTDLSSPLDAA